MDERHRILVVEDQDYWREDIFRETLEDAGYQVETAGSYRQAVAALEGPPFNLVVVDVNLTGDTRNRDGVRVLERMLALGHDPRIIVVTGSDSRAAAAASVRRFHPFAFLDKTTFDMGQFIALVRQALERPAISREHGDPTTDEQTTLHPDRRG